MNNCPICNEHLGSNVILATTLDEISSDMYSYAKCGKCGVYVLLDSSYGKKDCVDYSESGYYSKEKVRWSSLINRISTFYNAYDVWTVKRAVAPFSLEGKRLLDIGCGKGRFLEVARKNGIKIFGIEPTQRSYEEAKKRLGNSVKKAMMKRDLFPVEHFDVVTMWHVFEHIPDPVSMMDSCFNVLKTKGKLVVAVPNYTSLISKIGGANWFNLDPPRHVIHYDPDSLGRLLQNTGFKVQKVRYFYPSLSFISALQTILNLVPISANFLFNFLKKNKKAMPESILVYAKDIVFTGILSVLIFPFILIAVPLLALAKEGDCITIIAEKS